MINLYFFYRDKHTILKFKLEDLDYEKILSGTNIENLSG